MICELGLPIPMSAQYDLFALLPLFDENDFLEAGRV